MPDVQRDAERAAGVAGGRLNPELVDDLLAQDPSVADAVERDAAGEAQVAEAGLLSRVPRHLDHRFFGDVLNRARQVHLALRQLGFRPPGGTIEEPLEGGDRSS